MRKVPWKRNLRRIPDSIRAKLRRIGSQPIVVSVAKRIRSSDVERGLYTHLGIRLHNGTPLHPNAVIPPVSSGRFSKANVEGKVEVLKDLPMVQRTYSITVPNYGDWSKGSHDIQLEREVYQRKIIPPRELAIAIELLDYSPGSDPELAFRFTVEEVLDPKDANFEEDLLFDLNLLQENVGHVDVFPSNSSRVDYLKTLHVAWEILPPGHRDANLEKILRGIRYLSEERRAIIVDRYMFLESLRPNAIIVGLNEFRRYFGAQFGDDLVVFENVQYGNALYVMGENWQTNSRLSRTQLLGKAHRDFERIPHVPGWKGKLRAIVNEYRRRNRRMPER